MSKHISCVQPLGQNQEKDLMVAMRQFHARPCVLRVGNFVQLAIWIDFESDHSFDLVAVFGRQHAEEQFRTKLVEAVATPVVRWREQEQVPAHLDQLHATPNRAREVEYMLKRSAVED